MLWPAGARHGVGLLVAAICLLHLTACVRVSVRPQSPEPTPQAQVAPMVVPAAKELLLTTADYPEEIVGQPAPTITPRQAAFLTTVTPLPRATPSPTATLPPPTPAIPRAETPPSELRIPAIDLQAPVVAIDWHQAEPGGEVVWDDPGSAVGWLRSSALPGEGSNVVLAGHHNIQGEVFRHLVDVAPGDEVYLVAGKITYRYVVRERFIIPEKHVSAEQREQNALWVAPTVDERLTMVTCWPYRDNTHRLIVIAIPTSAVEPS